MPMNYPRDLKGYGRLGLHARWPMQARVALQFVLNYEEGGENAVLHGDAGSERFVSEMFNPSACSGRHLSMEGILDCKDMRFALPQGCATHPFNPQTAFAWE